MHQHLIPDSYRRAVEAAGIEASGGRRFPAWSVEDATQLMDLMGIRTAVVSISTPSVNFIEDPVRAAAFATELNDLTAAIRSERPGRFGFYATVPLPDVPPATVEAERALDQLSAEGIVLAANSRGVYLGAPEQEPLFAALDARDAVVLVHPGELPGPAAEGIVPFAVDFLLDTTRAAYLLVRNGIVRRYPRIRFILSHAGGFVPYASHRLAVSIASEGEISPLEALEGFESFYFDTALSSSPAALPTLLAFARPGHILFGSDWPFAPVQATQYFANGLDQHGLKAATLDAINHVNADRLFPRLATLPPPPLPEPTRAETIAGPHSARSRGPLSSSFSPADHDGS